MSKEEVEKSKEWLYVEELLDGSIEVSFREDVQKRIEELAKKEGKTFDEFVSQGLLDTMREMATREVGEK